MFVRALFCCVSEVCCDVAAHFLSSVSETPGLSIAHLGGLGNGGWRGALRVAQRQAPLWGEGSGKLGWGPPAEAEVGPFGGIVRAPSGERGAGLVQGREQGLVQEFVPQAAVEALEEGILGRLSGRDIVPVKLAVSRELQDRVRGELGPIVADNRLGLAAGVEPRCQLARHPCARQGGVGDQGQPPAVGYFKTIETDQQR